MEKFLETDEEVRALFDKLHERALKHSFFTTSPQIAEITLDLMFETFKAGYSQAVFTAEKRENDIWDEI